MLFSSIPFLFYFLPVVIAIYYILPWKIKNFWLLMVSLFFYGWGEPKYVFLMIFSIISFYICGRLIESSKTQKWKKIWLIVSITSSLALLGVFKYADFFISTVNYIPGINIKLLRLALPIGISFYTFQCLSYTIDVYRGDVQAQKNIISFGTYVSLFPQLIAGPIVRYIDVEKEINKRRHSWNDFKAGLNRFVIGLAKKIIIANQMGVFINIFRKTANPSVIYYWLYAFAFMIQIYFDFSGYSDMAIGLGRIFGFHFIENFNYPYMSKSISEFWRRWHMSLGSWFRDYVYIPLGGNRVSHNRWIFNVFVVWALTGLWHGAAWNFVLWGLFYAICLIYEKSHQNKKENQKESKWKEWTKIANTLLLVMFGFILFNAENTTQLFSDLSGLIGYNYVDKAFNIKFVNKETTYYLMSYAGLFAVSILGSTPYMKNKILSLRKNEKYNRRIDNITPFVDLFLFIVCISFLVDGTFNPFLYFRF